MEMDHHVYFAAQGTIRELVAYFLAFDTVSSKDLR